MQKVDKIWPEVQKVKTENRHELVLSGKEVSARINDTGLDCTIFQLISLNFLSLSQTCLSDIPDEIEYLINLQNLVLHTNKLEKINEKIGSLKKLKVLDLSRNAIKNIPESLGELSQLTTLYLNVNCIEDCPSALTKCTSLTVIDLSNNQLKSFPDLCCDKLINLVELKLAENTIEEIPNSIHHLSVLKVLNISSNKIKVLPGELSDCQKLKEISLKNNPISDRRLLKLIDQCRTKQILEYVKQHCLKTSSPKENNSTKRKNGKKIQNEHTDDVQVGYKYTITVESSLPDFKIVVTNEVKTVREHIIGCIVNNVIFTEESFKKFIQLQNKLHDTICDKRNSATIATHDFNKLGPGYLLYTTSPPNQLKIKPLNRATLMTGLELFTALQTEANALRKEKKRNTYSGIHKYLYLLEGRPQYPCLVTGQGEIISLPPITNSDISKIDVNTTKIFVEVTSSISNIVCRTVMDTLLKDMVLQFEQNLEIVQVKTTDSDSNLKNVYPSNNDLKYEKSVPIKIERNF